MDRRNLTTGLALPALGPALLALARPWAWWAARQKRVDPGNPVSSRVFVIAFTLTALTVAAVGALSYHNYEAQYRQDVERALSTVVRLKASELARWREERLADARILFRSTAFSALMRRALANSRDASAQNFLQDWLREILGADGYSNVWLTDERGIVRISIPDQPVPVEVQEHAREAMRTARVRLLDFHYDRPGGPLHLSLVVPIFDTSDGGRSLGVVVLDVDPGRYLYPAIDLWPVPGGTANLQLIRRDGDDALVLRQPGPGGKTTSLPRVSLSSTKLAVVKAALGQQGIVAGLSVQAVPVIAAVRAIPDSPWVLIAQLDSAEILDSTRRNLWLTASLVGALILVAGTAAGLLWRHQSARHYRELLRASEALARQKILYDMLSHTNQAIVRVSGREELFSTVCRIAVEHGSFRFVVIGLVDQHSQIRPVAQFGEDSGYLERLRVSPDAFDSSGPGPIGQALRSGRHAVSNEFLDDPATAAWHEAASCCGLRAAAAFPIRERGSTVGVMVFYAGEAGFFTEDILPTLDEMAADVSFALDVLAQDAELGRAMNALRESESSYRQLFQANPHPMWVYDSLTLGFLAVNDAALAQYGYSKEEFHAMTIADIRPPEDVQRLLARDPNLGDGRGDNAGVWRHRRKDGTLLDVEITSHVFDFGGRRAKVVLAHDVTERLAAFNALRAAEARMRATFDHSPVGMAHVTPKGALLRVNRTLCEIVGHSREELIGLEFRRITHPDDLDRTRENARKLLAAEVPAYSMEARYTRSNGEPVWVNLTVALVRTDSGEPDYFIAVVENISARKLAEAALSAAEQQFRSLVEQSVDAICVVQGARFVYVNPRFAEILGYGSAEELSGKEALSVIAESQRDAVASNVRNWIDPANRDLDYGTTGRRKDGSHVEVQVRSARMRHRGEPAILAMVQDISARRRAEEQTRRYIAQIETALMRTVEVVTKLGEMRDPYTVGHEKRVAEIAVAIGSELGFDAHRLEGLRIAGHLHDIGKIAIPAEILAKPGKLTALERLLIQRHSQDGYDLLKGLEFPWPVAEIALQHHERMDGSGYPRRLEGEGILLEARVLAVADTVEAMASHRPYRSALGLPKALSEITVGRGTKYDPAVVDACVMLFQEKGYVLPSQGTSDLAPQAVIPD